MKKKNILIVAAVFPPEPVVSANLFYDMANELAKDHNVTVLRPLPTRPAGFKFDNYDNTNFPFKVVEMKSYTNAKSDLLCRFRESVSCGKEAAKYIKRHHKEIDFIYNDPWQLFGVNIVARTAVKYGIPYVMVVQDIYPESISSKLPLFLGRIVNKILLPIDRYNETHAVFVHTISDKMVKHLSKTRGIAEDKYIVVRNWQNEQDFINYTESKEDKNDTLTFMYMGNVGPLAGLDFTLDAFKRANLNNARFVIAGSGSAKQDLIKKVNTEKISNVEFWDVPGGQVPATQAKADIMVLPVKKGFAMSSIPSKLPAYMFSSKPVLASVDLESETAKCITDSDAGWVVEPENTSTLAKAFNMISTLDEEKLQQAGARGFEYAMKNLSRSGNLPILANAILKSINNG